MAGEERSDRGPGADPVGETRGDRPGAVPGRVLAAAGLAALAAACGGDGGNGDDGGMGIDPDRPASLVRVSSPSDTVVSRDTLADPVTVRVENADGGAVSGVTVAFEVAGGPGSLDPDTTTTDASGEARSTFVAPNASGDARVRASLPDAPSVDPVEFELAIVAPGVVRLEPDGGDDQEAEPGSQLPEELRVRALSGDNVPAGGVQVVWSIEEEPALGSVTGSGAELTADTVFTGADGRARTLLTLSAAEGEHTVRAAVPGQGDTVRFTANASEGAVGGIALDSVRPRPLEAGASATLFGDGFGDQASALSVTVEGVEATVSSASDDRLEVDVPSFEGRCLPARSVGVRVREDDRLSNGLTADLEPARPPLELAAGEVRTLRRADEVRCLQFAAGDREREYRIQVQSAARNTGRTPMRMVTRSGPASGATPAVRLVGRRREAAFADRSPAALRSSWELELRRNIRRELRRVGARPARDEAGRETEAADRLRLSHADGPPSVGDTVDISYYVNQNLGISCSDTVRRIGAEVRAVGERVALVEDTLAQQVEGFDDADYRRLRDEFDDAIFAANSAYFGSPTDIDHNERVMVLITPEVNKLTPAGSNTMILGFFSSADLADSGDPQGDGTDAGGVCSTSNEGELLYLLAPDPQGKWGPETSRQAALQSVRGTSAHEYQHLLNAGIRLIQDGGDFGDLLDTWLDEGLSHVAEEVVGMRLGGLQPRSNLTHSEAGGGSEDFDAFFVQNLLRLSRYYQNPSDSRTLAINDPGGVESLEMRGFAWSFLRWLADTRVPDGSGGFLGGPAEEELFRALARGGPSQLEGVDNVLRAVEQVAGQRPEWGELVADFSPVGHVDDDVEGIPVRFSYPSWDLRDQYASLGTTGGYPLSVTEAGFEATAFDFELRGTTQIYFRFTSSGAAPSLSLRLDGRSGGPVPGGASPQVTVVRVR